MAQRRRAARTGEVGSAWARACARAMPLARTRKKKPRPEPGETGEGKSDSGELLLPDLLLADAVPVPIVDADQRLSLCGRMRKRRGVSLAGDGPPSERYRYLKGNSFSTSPRRDMKRAPGYACRQPA